MIAIPSGTPLVPTASRIGGVHYFDSDGTLRYAADDTTVPSKLGGFRSDPQATNILPESDYRSLTNWQPIGATISPAVVTLIDTAQATTNTIRESISYGRHGVRYSIAALPNTYYAVTVAVRRGAGNRNATIRVTNDVGSACTLDLVQHLGTGKMQVFVGVSAYSEQQSLWTVIYAVMRTQSAAQYTLELLSCASDRGDTTDYFGDGTSALEIDWLTIAPSMMPTLPVQGFRTRYPTQYVSALAALGSTYWVAVDCVLYYSLANLGDHTLITLRPVGLALQLTATAGVSASISLRNTVSSSYSAVATVSGVVVAYGMLIRCVIAVVAQRAIAAVRTGDVVRLLQHDNVLSVPPTSTVIGDDRGAATYRNIRYGADALTAEQMLAMLDVIV